MLSPLYCEAWAAALATDTGHQDSWHAPQRLGAYADETRIPAATKRRLGGYSRTAICCGLGVLAEDDADLVFASRYGDLTLAHTLLNDILAAIPPSPAGFSMSVHNAAAGILDILRGSRTGHTAVAAGPDSLSAGLLEAWLRLTTGAAAKAVLIYTEQTPSPVLRDFAEPGLLGTAFALKLSLTPSQAPRFRPAQTPSDAPNIRSDLLARRLIATLQGTAPAFPWRANGLHWAMTA